LAGAVEIEYRVSGSGIPVLLLATSVERSLFAALAQRYRVIVPCLPTSVTNLDTWLAALIDGLGLSQTRVVVVGGATAELASIAREQPERIARVFTVPTDAEEPEVAELLAAIDVARPDQA